MSDPSLTAAALAGMRLVREPTIGKADHCQQGHELATFVDNPKHVWCVRCHAAWERELSDAVIAAYRAKGDAAEAAIDAREAQLRYDLGHAAQEAGKG